MATYTFKKISIKALERYKLLDSIENQSSL